MRLQTYESGDEGARESNNEKLKTYSEKDVKREERKEKFARFRGKLKEGIHNLSERFERGQERKKAREAAYNKAYERARIQRASQEGARAGRTTSQPIDFFGFGGSRKTGSKPMMLDSDPFGVFGGGNKRKSQSYDFSRMNSDPFGVFGGKKAMSHHKHHKATGKQIIIKLGR